MVECYKGQMSKDPGPTKLPKLDPVTAWLTRVVRIGGAHAFVGHGVEVLVEAALRSGGGRKSRTDASVKIWPEQFERTLCNLPRRCSVRIDLPDVELTDLKHQLEANLLKERPDLVPVCRKKPVRLDAAALVKLIRRVQAAREKFARDTLLDREVDDLAPSPQRLARAAYAVLKARREDLHVEALDVDAVLLLGAVRAALVTRMQLCWFCFRWALPGNRYCLKHTLSGVDASAAHAKQRRYAAAAEIAQAFKATPAARALDRRLNITQTTTGLAKVLLGAAIPNEETQLLRIKRKLSASPNLLTALGKDVVHVAPVALQTELRRRLDPLEWRLGGWLPKIKAAEVWYSLQPGVRGRGRATRERMEQALRLARRGLSKSEVARKLELSPSAISKWLKRHQDDSVVKELARLLLRH